MGKMNGLQKVEYKGILVLTTQQIAEAYGTDNKIISKNFTRNAERYVEGKHFICLTGDALKEFRANRQFDDLPMNVNKLYLWTKKGAFLHAKSLNTDVAWEVYDRLVDDYFDKREEEKKESLDSVNETVKIFTDLMQKVGCSAEIQLLTAKTIMEQNTGIILPITIRADKQYYDTEYIARKAGMYVRSSGKPAEKAVNEIIRRINIPKDMYIETWETNGKWQGTVKKYSDEVINMVRDWCVDNDFPDDIEYTQSDGQIKKYHIKWKEVA